jgi:hypothetical protein
MKSWADIAPVTSGAASCWETVVAFAEESASNQRTGCETYLIWLTTSVVKA